MGTLSSLNILIVEDNESVRNAISYLLSESKYSVERSIAERPRSTNYSKLL